MLARYTHVTSASLVGKLPSVVEISFGCLFSFIFVFMIQDQGLKARIMLPYLVCDLCSKQD